MSKGTKITSFFDARRRECFLQKWEHLKTTAGEARIKIDIAMPLLNHSVLAMPAAVSEAFALMCKDDCNVARANLDIYLEGMTIEFFTTDEAKSPIVSSTGVTAKKFHLETTGEGDKRKLDLVFVVYIPANVNVRDWAWDHLHSTFFLEAAYSQTEMEFFEDKSGDDDAPVDDDDEEEESDLAGVTAEVETDPLMDFQESDPAPAHAKAESDDEMFF